MGAGEPKKVNVYNLGEMGVNIDSSPIHSKDGELLRAQNWQTDPTGLQGGIRRRDGLAKLNTGAMAGSVSGIIGLPLPDLSLLTRHFYATVEDGTGNNFRHSTDGTTWAYVTSGSKPRQAADLGSLGTGSQALYSLANKFATLNNKMYYPGHDYTPGTTPPTIHVFDGTNDYVLCYISQNPYVSGSICRGVYSITPFSDTQLLVSTYDDNTAIGRGRVLLLDTTSGALTHIAPETDIQFGGGLNPFVFQGKVWLGSIHGSGGTGPTIAWARLQDKTWTIDVDPGSLPAAFTASTGYIINGVVFLGELYVSVAADTPTNGRICKRTNAGVWSVAKQNDGTGANNFLGPLIVSKDGNTIFAYWSSVSGGAAPVNRIISSTDGATWATDYDVSANVGASYSATGMPLLDENGDIYWPSLAGAPGASAKMLKRTTGGVWSIVDTYAGAGQLMRIRF